MDESELEKEGLEEGEVEENDRKGLEVTKKVVKEEKREAVMEEEERCKRWR